MPDVTAPPVDNPTVSVAMATYQGERYLRAQLASIAAGTRLPDELVVCDDGSTDDTRTILHEFARSAAFPVRLHFHDQNLGTLSAFETAIRHCDGEIIVLSDQDDVWRADRIEALVELMGDNPDAMLAFSDAALIGPDGQDLGRFWPMIGITPSHIHQLTTEPFGLLVARPMVGGCTMAMRTRFAEALLPMPDIRFGRFGPLVHDRWLSMALAAFGPFALTSEPLLQYRLHSAQQIGVPARRLRRLVPPHLRKWRQVLVPRAIQRQRLEVDRLYLVELRNRLTELGIDPPVWVDLDDAIDHLRVRVNLPAHRGPNRTARVLREWRTGRYRRFALGGASAAGDIVRR